MRSLHHVKTIKIITAILLLLIFAGSASTVENPEASRENEIRDLILLPQDPFLYLSGDLNSRMISPEEQEDYLREFRKLYFSPWDQTVPRHGMDVQNWIFSHFGNREGFGENLQQRNGEWIRDLKENADPGSLGTLNSKAISVRRTDLRLLPTEKPFFHDSSLPGEGYPFDYIQNSSVHPGEPLFISHISRDGAWAWSETSYAAGWIRIEDIAFVDKDFIERWTSLELSAAILDDIPVKDMNGIFRFMAYTGTILPLQNRYITKTRILIPVRDMDGNAMERSVKVDSDLFRPHPLQMTGWNAARVCDALMNTDYGWGGLMGNRDCSSTIRDMLLPFGIWMPRNSAAQARTGLAISIGDMDRTSKANALLREGKPFATLVNKPGHVMLYIGSYRGKPVVFHNTWGLKTIEDGSESRHIIGKTVITTLEPGSELKNLHPEGGLLIDSLTSLTLLGGIR